MRDFYPDYDPPLITELGKTTYPVAKKEHECSVCRKPIKIGEKYKRMVFKDDDNDGKVFTHKEHFTYCLEDEIN